MRDEVKRIMRARPARNSKALQESLGRSSVDFVLLAFCACGQKGLYVVAYSWPVGMSSDFIFRTVCAQMHGSESLVDFRHEFGP